MADEDYGDEGFYYDDDDYLYVEDSFAIADELAETQIPDPGYAGTTYEIALETEDWDVYEYFGELEWADDDEYWEEGGEPRSGDKRKRGAAITSSSSAKRRKGESESVSGPIIYKSFAARLPPAAPVLKKRKESFALLPDWRERFATVSDEDMVRDMPEDMRRAAEGNSEHDDDGQEAEEGWEDDEPGPEGGGGGGCMGDLDPEMLKAMLKQKLSETGMDVDGKALDDMIAGLLSGGSDAAAGGLADLLLGQAQETEESGASKWLEQQGVNLDAEEDDAAQTPASAGAEMQISPPDSAVGIAAADPADKAVPPASRKRKGAASYAEPTQTSKRRQISRTEDVAEPAAVDAGRRTKKPVSRKGAK